MAQNRIERSTSPVDPRIINEFYSDQPRSMHQYQLEGRQYVVYEGNNFSDVEPYRQGNQTRRQNIRMMFYF